MQRRWAVVSTLSVLVFLGGCDAFAAETDPPGPLDTGTDLGVTCLARTGSKDFTNGSNVIRYRGEEPLTITKVDLVDGKGSDLAEVLLVPVRPDLVGSWSQWPPPNASTVLQGAVPAEGAEMGGDRANGYNLVAQVTRADVDKPVAAAALRLFYTVGNKKYGSIATVRLGVSSGSGSC